MLCNNHNFGNLLGITVGGIVSMVTGVDLVVVVVALEGGKVHKAVVRFKSVSLTDSVIVQFQIPV